MRERIGFAMDVGCKYLGAFRQIEHGAQVDYLGGCIRYGGVAFREQFEVTQFASIHYELL